MGDFPATYSSLCRERGETIRKTLTHSETQSVGDYSFDARVKIRPCHSLGAFLGTSLYQSGIFSLAPVPLGGTGVIGEFDFTGRFNGLLSFRLQPLRYQGAKAAFGKPAEAGWEKSGVFADPGVNAWTKEKQPKLLRRASDRSVSPNVHE